MAKIHSPDDKNVSPDDISPNTRVFLQQFPMRRWYFFIIIFLTVISIVNITIQSDSITTGSWKLTTTIAVTSTTLVLLLLLWLPILLPWFFSSSSRFRDVLGMLREQGVEEIEAGSSGVRVVLSPAIQKAADTYEQKVLGVMNQNMPSVEKEQQLEYSYEEATALAQASEYINPADALNQINKLASYYNEVRNKMPSGHKRKQLLTQVSSAMWALIPSTQSFPVGERLRSAKGGERLSAYKYLEWKPSVEHLDVLLSRAMGVLETPFGQYAALLALRQLARQEILDAPQKMRIVQLLRWEMNLDYVGFDRRHLMKTIIKILES